MDRCISAFSVGEGKEDLLRSYENMFKVREDQKYALYSGNLVCFGLTRAEVIGEARKLAGGIRRGNNCHAKKSGFILM